MAEMKIKILGMSCGHCVMRTQKSLDTLPGVTNAEVEVGSATITYDESKVKKEDIEAAVERAGYKVAR